MAIQEQIDRIRKEVSTQTTQISENANLIQQIKAALAEKQQQTTEAKAALHTEEVSV